MDRLLTQGVPSAGLRRGQSREGKARRRSLDGRPRTAGPASCACRTAAGGRPTTRSSPRTTRRGRRRGGYRHDRQRWRADGAGVRQRYDYQSSRWLADGGFTSLKDIIALTRKGITVFSPLKPRRNPAYDPATPRPGAPPEIAAWRRRWSTMPRPDPKARCDGAPSTNASTPTSDDRACRSSTSGASQRSRPFACFTHSPTTSWPHDASTPSALDQTSFSKHPENSHQ